MAVAARALVLVLACAVLVSCSSDPSGIFRVDGVGAATNAPDPLPSDADLVVVTRAAARTLATSADVAGTVEISGGGTRLDVGPPQALRFTGRYDLRRGVGTMSVGLASAGTGTVTQLMLPSTVYVSNLGTVRPGFWGAVERRKMRVHYLYRAPGNDPRILLQLVAGAEEMARTGQELIGTTPTVRYRGYITSASLVAHAGAAAQEQLLRLLRVLGPQSRRIEVWTSLTGYVVQVRLGFVARQGSQTVRQTAQLDLSRFGVKVRVTAPPKNRVTPVSSLPAFLFG